MSLTKNTASAQTWNGLRTRMNSQLHWVLDTVFNEDYCRGRKDNGAQNLNLIRKIVMSLLKSMALSEIVPTKKSGSVNAPNRSLQV